MFSLENLAYQTCQKVGIRIYFPSFMEKTAYQMGPKGTMHERRIVLLIAGFGTQSQ